MRTMKAVRIHAYGGPEVLIYEDAPVPDVRADEVLIKVHAVSVNPFDWKLREGYMAAWFNHSLPLIIGWDVSGTIEAVGASADIDRWVADSPLIDVQFDTRRERIGAYAPPFHSTCSEDTPLRILGFQGGQQ